MNPIPTIADAGAKLLSWTSGFNDQSTKDRNAELDARGGKMVKQLLLAGLAGGAGVGSLVALKNQLGALREEQEAEDPTRLDDDTLYVRDITKSAEFNRWLAPGVGVSGAVLGGAATYAAVTAINDKIVKRRRLRALDEAQQAALETSDMEIEKSAEVKMNVSDMVVAFPVATAILSAAAAGGLTYAALNKALPTVTKTKSPNPKRIRLVGDTGTIEPLAVNSDTAGHGKLTKAAAEQLNDLEAAGCEYLIRYAAELQPDGISAGLLEKVASIGMLDQMEDLLVEAGVDAVVATLPATRTLTTMEKQAASMVLSSSRLLAPTAEMFAAAEVVEAIPALYETLTSAPEDRLEKLAHVGRLIAYSEREQLIPAFEKLAAATAPASLYEMMRQMSRGAPTGGPELTEKGEASLTTDAGGSFGEDVEQEESVDNEAETDHRDAVESILG